MKRVMFLAVFLVLLIPNFVFAAGDTGKYVTQYPIVLAHGMALRNEMFGTVNYFWKVQESLEKEGVEVYESSVTAMGGTEQKAIDFRNELIEILAISGAEKVNIIGHSHGTLYSRYAMSLLYLDSAQTKPVGNRVASWTSLCGPHRGSVVADIAAGVFGVIPQSIQNIIEKVVNTAYKVLGDSNPDGMSNMYDLTSTYMEEVFNEHVEDLASVYYQSYATVKRGLTADLVFEPTFIVMSLLEGRNDGIVSVNSAKWGNFRGEIRGALWSGGVSHFNAHGQILGVTPGFDHVKFFKDIAEDLKNRGF